MMQPEPEGGRMEKMYEHENSPPAFMDWAKHDSTHQSLPPVQHLKPIEGTYAYGGTVLPPAPRKSAIKNEKETKKLQRTVAFKTEEGQKPGRRVVISTDDNDTARLLQGEGSF